jgi:hypothetical protein
MRLSPQQIAGYARAAGFPPDQIATATAVALAESAGETTATNRNSNGSTDYGLWQINTIHGQLLNQGDKFNPLDNAKMALTVYARAGNKWTPWTVYKSGAYRGQMSTATLAAGNPVDPAELGASATNAVENAPTGTATAASSPLDMLGPIGTMLGQVVGTFNRLTSGALWLRVGAFILGSCLIGFSLLRLSGADQMAFKAAKMAVTKGVVK